MRSLILSFLLSIPLSVATARAAPCNLEGSKHANELSFDLADEEVVRSLRASFYLGLGSPDLPPKRVAESKAPCSLGTFVEGGSKFEIFGQTNALPIRWATTPARPGFIIFIALMPPPDMARRWEETEGKYNRNGDVTFTGRAMWAVALSTGDEKRRVFKFYDDIPDNERLKSLMQAIARDQSHWLLTYDTQANEVTINPNP